MDNCQYFILILLLLALKASFLTFITTNAQDIFKVDKSGWVDPSDMFYYDEVNKAMIKEDDRKQREEHKYVSPSTKAVPSTDENSSYNSVEFLKLRNILDECQVEVKTCKSQRNEISGIPYIKRFIQKLLRLFQESDAQDEEVILRLKLSYENRKVLNNFIGSSNDQLANVDEVLSELFDESGLNYESPFVAVFTSDVTQVFLLGLIVIITIYIFWTVSFWKIFIAGFIISVFWRWQHMYKEAVAAHHAELFKFKDLPKECNPSEYTWSDSLMLWMFKSEDKCVKYYKHLEVDPFWDVSPADAFVDSVVRIILYPLSMIGTELGKFFTNLHQNMPTFTFWVVLPNLMIMIVLFLLMLFGYDFNLLFGALSISKKTGRISAPTNVPLITDRIQEIAPESLENEHRTAQLKPKKDKNHIEHKKEKIMEKEISPSGHHNDSKDEEFNK